MLGRTLGVVVLQWALFGCAAEVSSEPPLPAADAGDVDAATDARMPHVDAGNILDRLCPPSGDVGCPALHTSDFGPYELRCLQRHTPELPRDEFGRCVLFCSMPDSGQGDSRGTTAVCVANGGSCIGLSDGSSVCWPH